MPQWIDPTPVTAAPELLAVVNGQRLLAETLTRRGFADPVAARSFLDPHYYTPASPFDLPDMDKAVDRIGRAVAHREKICVWGDFDVDGQTATALLVSALRGLAANVTYYIPHRQKEGHGITIPRLDTILRDGTQVILTCDTGITEHPALDYARNHGVDVVITDHHQLPATLPDVYAAVNPQRLPPTHPLFTLPGVGCAYKLVEALYEQKGRSGELTAWLDLVALGIVADVATQTGDTRYLLQRGLSVLRNTQRLGLRVLLEQNDITPASVNEETIGFAIAPRLNALGRLDDANAAVEFLTTDDLERARILANRLDGLNNERKHQTEQVYKAAQAQIETNPKLLEDAVLVLAHEHWPGGIVGVVANRLVEQYRRPVILLTTPPGGFARGSARSIPGIDITAAIAQHADLLQDYGGHTQAAGLSLSPEHIPELRRRLSRTVAAISGGIQPTPTLTIDAYVPLAEVSLGLVDALEQLAPFGPGNPPLLLATAKVALKSHRSLGRTGEHLRLTVADESGAQQEVVWWRANIDTLPPGRFDLAFVVRANDYQGRREVQLEFVDAHPVLEAPREFAQRAEVQLLDFRALTESAQLAELQQLTNALVWNEGEAIPGVESVRRDGLRPAAILAIWTTPPSPRVLQAALAAVNPGAVVLFGIDPGLDTSATFLPRLAGLVKHVLKAKNGETTLIALSGAMAHRESTVRAGLLRLAARGDITILHDDGDLLRLSQPSPDAIVGTHGRASLPPENDTVGATTRGRPPEEEIHARLKVLLQETAAYRAYFRRADKTALIQI